MDTMASVVRDELLASCADLRAAIEGLDAAALAWAPVADASPLAALVRHGVTSTRYLLGGGVRGTADQGQYRADERPAAFAQRPADAAELGSLIDGVEAEIRGLTASVRAAELTGDVTFERAYDTPPPSRAWMFVHAAVHLREHTGHAQLTRQLLDAR